MRTAIRLVVWSAVVLVGSGQVLADAPRVDLAEIGTVGDLPPARQTLLIELDADGAIFIRDREVTYEKMRKELQGFARDEPAPHVVIRADRSLPWFAVQWVMGACAKERIYRVFHAARSEEEGAAEGALALYLPGPGEGIGPTAQEPDDEVETCFELRVAPRREATSREAVHASLSRRLELLSAEERPEAYLEFHAAPGVPTGHCLRLLDAAFRSGIRRINVYSWDEEAPTTTSLKRRVAELREARKGPFGVTIDREEVPEPAEAATLQPVKRVRGSFAGFFPEGGSGFSGLMDVSPEEPAEVEDDG